MSVAVETGTLPSAWAAESLEDLLTAVALLEDKAIKARRAAAGAGG